MGKECHLRPLRAVSEGLWGYPYNLSANSRKGHSREWALKQPVAPVYMVELSSDGSWIIPPGYGYERRARGVCKPLAFGVWRGKIQDLGSRSQELNARELRTGEALRVSGVATINACACRFGWRRIT